MRCVALRCRACLGFKTRASACAELSEVSSLCAPSRPAHLVVALSGGVDSSVAALFLHRCVHTILDVESLQSSEAPPPLALLMEAMQSRTPWSSVCGRAAPLTSSSSRVVTIEAVHFRCWSREDSPHRYWCAQAERDWEDAQRVARQLGLWPPFQSPPIMDFSADYAQECWSPLLHAFASGETLNVDVLCNEHIKFGALLRALSQNRPSSLTDESKVFLVTGHYARTVYLPHPDGSGSRPVLSKPFTVLTDPLNDQVHFLARVKEAALRHAVFPLGHLFATKKDVREVAKRFGLLDVARKKTSTGVCTMGCTAVQEGGLLTGTAPISKAARSRSELRFPHLLREFIPSPRAAAGSPATRFVLTETPEDEQEELSMAQFHWGPQTQRWLADPSLGALPAYTFTVGQKLHYCRQRPDGKRELETFYVSKKILRKAASPDEQCGDGLEARVLDVVLLVRTFTHPSFFSEALRVKDWTPQLPPSFKTTSGPLHRCVCFVAIRHHDPLRIATITWEEMSSSAVVTFPLAVPRAAVPGQLLVAYLPACWWALDGESDLHARGEALKAFHQRCADLVVVGSAWVT